MSREYLFTCAICQRERHSYWNGHGPTKEIAPVCRYCESEYGDRGPQAGAFMDRRKAVQISALANALNGIAHVKQWEARHGRA